MLTTLPLALQLRQHARPLRLRGGRRTPLHSRYASVYSFNDTVLTALDAKTGKRVWSIQNGDPKLGMTNTNAPLIVKDNVVAGIAGGEFGVRGFLAAYNMKTGKMAW